METTILQVVNYLGGYVIVRNILLIIAAALLVIAALIDGTVLNLHHAFMYAFFGLAFMAVALMDWTNRRLGR